MAQCSEGPSVPAPACPSGQPPSDPGSTPLPLLHVPAPAGRQGREPALPDLGHVLGWGLGPGLVKVAQVLKWRALSEASRAGGPGQRTESLWGCGGVRKDPSKGLPASLSIPTGMEAGPPPRGKAVSRAEGALPALPQDPAGRWSM